MGFKRRQRRALRLGPVHLPLCRHHRLYRHPILDGPLLQQDQEQGRRLPAVDCRLLH